MKKSIKNYTTSIKVEKTIGEIESILAKFGASKIMKEFDKEGNPESLSFIIATEHGTMPFKLPMRLEKVYSILCKSQIPKKLRSREQAARIGWRILKDWVDSQMALLQIEMAKIEEILLPYVVQKGGKTMYEMIEERGFKYLQLEEHQR